MQGSHSVSNPYLQGLEQRQAQHTCSVSTCPVNGTCEISIVVLISGNEADTQGGFLTSSAPWKSQDSDSGLLVLRFRFLRPRHSSLVAILKELFLDSLQFILSCIPASPSVVLHLTSGHWNPSQEDWFVACPGEGSPRRQGDTQPAGPAAPLRLESPGSRPWRREPDAVHSSTGRMCICKQPGGGLTAQMDCDSEGHCSSLPPPKRGKHLSLISPLDTRAHLAHSLDFMGHLQWGVGLGHLADLIPDES